MTPARPHPTAKVSELLQPLRELEMQITLAEAFLEALQCRRGQETASIHIAGREVRLTYQEPNRSWGALPVQGLHTLREAVIRNQQDHLVALRSRLEGMRRALVAAAKAC